MIYDDVVNDLVRQLAAANRQEAARIRTRLREIKQMQREHSTT